MISLNHRKRRRQFLLQTVHCYFSDGTGRKCVDLRRMILAHSYVDNELGMEVYLHHYFPYEKIETKYVTNNPNRARKSIVTDTGK